MNITQESEEMNTIGKYEKRDVVDLVRHWRSVFGLKLSDGRPSMPENDVINSCVDLLNEEVDELMTALMEGNVREVKDGGADVLFSLIQLMECCNIDIKDVTEAVYESNMSKLCKTIDEARNTVKAYGNGTHPNKPNEKIDCYIQRNGSFWIVRRESDKKVMKSLSFQEPRFN